MRRGEAAQALRLADAVVHYARLIRVLLALGLRSRHEHVAGAARLALEAELAEGLVRELVLFRHLPAGVALFQVLLTSYEFDM